MKVTKLIWISFITLTIILLIYFLSILIHPSFCNKLDLSKYPNKTTVSDLTTTEDPINIVFIGSKDEITKAFEDAGWVVPLPITKQTTSEIVLKSIQNKPYPNGPVSDLYLYKRKQDLAFELPSDSIRHRHHIRIWDTHTKFNNQEVWLAAASYDKGVKIRGLTNFPTHSIDANIDGETQYVLSSLEKGRLVESYWAQQLQTPIVDGKNATGDRYYTDGEVDIMELSLFQTTTENLSCNNSYINLRNSILKIFENY